MKLNRRSFCIASGAVVMASCAGPRSPYGMTLSPEWAGFKSRFMDPTGRIVDTGNNNISHTEGQGYAMVLAAQNGDRPAFEQIWRWTKSNLQRRTDALFSWRYVPSATPPVDDPNNATDGDILIAWGLQLGADAFDHPPYAMEAERIRAAILRLLTIPYAGMTVLLPGIEGFRFDERVKLNPAY